MNFNKIILFDLEMCCWNDGRIPSTGEIIEIGLVELDLLTKKITKEASILVKPDYDEVSDFTELLTGHSSRKILKQGVPLHTAIRRVLRTFGGKGTIYGAWGRDDLYLANECDKKGVKMPFKEFINIYNLFGFKYRPGSNSVSLKEALRTTGVDFEGRAHSGLVDARNLANLYLEIIK